MRVPAISFEPLLRIRSMQDMAVMKGGRKRHLPFNETAINYAAIAALGWSPKDWPYDSIMKKSTTAETAIQEVPNKGVLGYGAVTQLNVKTAKHYSRMEDSTQTMPPM